jgi:hypothetical protein
MYFTLCVSYEKSDRNNNLNMNINNVKTYT